MSFGYWEILSGFVGGLGLFIYGMHIMGEGLQKAAGNKMKSLLEMLTKNRALGVLVGAVVTAIIQSSSATTVMVVGFVNAGIMSLKQAVGVIMGANIGTTVTGQIIRLAEVSGQGRGDTLKFILDLIKPSHLAPLAIAVGIGMLLFTKNKKIRQIGEIIAGFGILFLGMELMSDAVKPLRKVPAFEEAFRTLGHSPILGILIGAGVTALVQSSSASVGILQSLALNGLLTFGAAVPIILGQNIGTCITAILASIGANKTAKRAAGVHLLFNLIGSLIFIVVIFSYKAIYGIPGWDDVITAGGIANFHTVFNILNTLLLVWFANWLVVAATKLLPDKSTDQNEEHMLHYLDERILSTPTIAVEQAVKEVVRMGNLALDNVKTAMDALLNQDSVKIQQVLEREKNINHLETAITGFLVQISSLSLNETDNDIITGLYHTVNDIERVGDHAENIAELAEILITEEKKFSLNAREELNEMGNRVIEAVTHALHARDTVNMELARIVSQEEDHIDKMEHELRSRHIERVAKQFCDLNAGVVYLDTISNLERISDHASNIALSVVDLYLGPKHQRIS